MVGFAMSLLFLVFLMNLILTDTLRAGLRAVVG
jgi:hypothetical protein